MNREMQQLEQRKTYKNLWIEQSEGTQHKD